MTFAFSEEVRAETRAYLRELGISPERLQAVANGLSPAEVNMIPEANLRPPRLPSPNTEIDSICELGGGYSIPGMFRVWARFQKEIKGHAPPGERPIEPDEPAHWIIERVCFGSTEITHELNEDELNEFADYMLENVVPGGEA